MEWVLIIMLSSYSSDEVVIEHFNTYNACNQAIQFIKKYDDKFMNLKISIKCIKDKQ